MEKQVSVHEAKQLDRQVYVSGRIKAMNESIYYTVDRIHAAINGNAKIRFHYCNWNTKKKLEARNNGDSFKVSPWALMWDHENYYLVAYDDYSREIKHYRVDKMMDVDILEEEQRDGKANFEQFDLASYTSVNFSMFQGEKENVKIRFDNSLVGVMIDRFGTDIIIKPDGADHSVTYVDVAVRNQFFGWIFSLGDKVEILGPEHVVGQLREKARRFYEKYE